MTVSLFQGYKNLCMYFHFPDQLQDQLPPPVQVNIGVPVPDSMVAVHVRLKATPGTPVGLVGEIETETVTNKTRSININKKKSIYQMFSLFYIFGNTLINFTDLY